MNEHVCGECEDCTPQNLKRCCVCETPFLEPVRNWDDYFVEIEDASFACASCAEAEGYPSDGAAA